jgi:hypothetical protein
MRGDGHDYVRTSEHLGPRQAAIEGQGVPDQNGQCPVVETVHRGLASGGSIHHRAPQLGRREPRCGQLGPATSQ